MPRSGERWLLGALYLTAAGLGLSAWNLSFPAADFPAIGSSVFLGSLFGLLMATQCWQMGHRWEVLAKLLVGTMGAQFCHPILAAQLGGRPESWWAALMLMLLTTLSVNAILHRHDDTITDSSEAGGYGLADLMALSTVLALVFPLARIATETPEILLQCFAWFGGLATLVTVVRYGLVQIRSVLSGVRQGSSTPLPQSKKLVAVAEAAAILGILLFLDLAMAVLLHQFRPGVPENRGLMILLLTAQLWQVVDLWISSQLTDNVTPVYRNRDLGVTRQPVVQGD